MFKPMLRRTRLRKPSYKKILKPLILVGVRSNVNDIRMLAVRCGYQVIGILDQYYYGNTKDIEGIPVIGDERWLLDSASTVAQQWKQHAWFFCSSWWTGKQFLNTAGLDLEKIRQDRIELLDQTQVRLANLIDPDAWIPNPSTVTLGQGIMIIGNVMIGNYCEIGDHSVIDWGVALSRHSKIGKGCIVGAGANIANYVIEDYVRIGVRAVLVGSKKDFSDARVGTRSVVHVGAVATDDIPADHIRTANHRTLARTLL